MKHREHQGLFPVNWLGIEGGYTVRAFKSAAGRQEWKIPYVGAAVGGELGHPALTSLVRFGYLPSVSVSGADSPDLGLALEAGLSAAPWLSPGFGLSISVLYRLERFDFPTTEVSRLEQFERLQLALGFQLGG